MAKPNSKKNVLHMVILIFITLLIYALFKFVIKPFKDKELEEGKSKVEVGE